MAPDTFFLSVVSLNFSIFCYHPPASGIFLFIAARGEPE
jgi:hypothetical protein